jgi:hypothetical protein
MRPVSRAAMGTALALSAGSMLAHNLYELPLSPIDLENSGPPHSPGSWVWRMRCGQARAPWRPPCSGGAS